MTPRRRSSSKARGGLEEGARAAPREPDRPSEGSDAGQMTPRRRSRKHSDSEGAAAKPEKPPEAGSFVPLTPRRRSASLTEPEKPPEGSRAGPSTPRRRTASLRRQGSSEEEKVFGAAATAAAEATKLPPVRCPSTPREEKIETPLGPRRTVRSLQPRTGMTPRQPAEEQQVQAPRAAPPRWLAYVPSASEPASQKKATDNCREVLEVQGYAHKLLSAVFETKVEEDAAVSLLEEQPEVAWLAQCLQRCPLPPFWTCLEDEGASNTRCYMNTEDESTINEPPLMAKFVDLARLMYKWRQSPANAAEVLQKLGKHRDSALSEAENTRKDWTGPHVDQATGSEFWSCSATGRSTWGDPGAAAEFFGQVAERLSQALPAAAAASPSPSPDRRPPAVTSSPRDRTPRRVGGPTTAEQELEPARTPLKGCSPARALGAHVPPGAEGEAVRLLGSWVYAGACEYHISRHENGQLYFLEGHFDREANVVIRTVAGRLRPRGRWFYADLADEDGVSQGEFRVRNVGEVNGEDCPGMYVLTQRAALAPSVNLANNKDIIMELDIGAVAKVVEVVHLEEQKRVRARLESPAGWISLMETVGGYRWAEKQGTAVSNFRLTMEDQWSADTVAHKRVDVNALRDTADVVPCLGVMDPAAPLVGQTPPRPSPARKMASRSPPVPPLSVSRSEASPLAKVAAREEEPTPPPRPAEGKAEEATPPPASAAKAGELAPVAAPATPTSEDQPEPPAAVAGPPPPPPSAPPPPWVVAMAGRRKEPDAGFGAATSSASLPASSSAIAAPGPLDSPARPVRSPAVKADSPSIFLVIEENPLDFGLGLGPDLGQDLGLPTITKHTVPQTPPRRAQTPPKALVVSESSPRHRSGPPGTPRPRGESKSRRSIRSRFFSAGGS